MNVIYGVRIPSDMMLVRQVSDWLTGSLGCLFGRREWYFERYMVAVIGDPADFVKANDLFRARVAAGTHSACLYVVRDPKQEMGVRDTLQWLRATFVERLGLSDRGQVFSQCIKTVCPVTGREVIFPDFDIVGFCPQAGNEADTLYDPGVHAPVVCLNQASDIYGFSIYMREMLDRAQSQNLGGDESDCTHRIIAQWNDMARKTLEIFRRRTNASLLHPAHISTDGRYYITPHDESTFLEEEKKLHVSEMPQIYLQRLLDEWERQEAGERDVELRGIVRPALCLATLGIAGLESARISE